MDVPRQSQSSQESSERALWFGAASGPAAWSLHLLLSYPYASLLACETRAIWPLHLITIVTGLVVVTGGVLSWREWRRLNESTIEGMGGFGSRQGYMALFGIMFNILAFIGILLHATPNFVIDPCTRNVVMS